MNTKSFKLKFSKTILLISCSIFFFSCSSSEEKSIEILDDQSFITDTNTDFFINRDETVKITVKATYNDGSSNIKRVEERGFVYSLTSKQTANSNNTIIPIGPGNSATGTFDNLLKDKIYFIRGFLKMKDGSYFYGNEIQASTTVNAKNTRSISLEVLAPELSIAITSTQIIARVKVTKLEKESPVELGFEYSIKSDFTNPIIALSTANNTTTNFSITTYGPQTANDLIPATKYYFRPYAKYADGTLTKGGASTVIISTKN